MYRSMASIARHHVVFVAYVVSLFWLLTSNVLVALEGRQGASNVIALLGLICSAVLSYTLIFALTSFVWRSGRDACSDGSDAERFQHELLLGFCTILLGCIAVAHFWEIGSIPIASALLSDDAYVITLIRQLAYTDLPGWMRYVSDYTIKAYAPVLLAVAWYYRSKWFWPILLLGTFYALALFFRAAPVFLLMPLMILLLQQRQWKRAAATLVYLSALLVLLAAVAAPTIRSALVRQLPLAWALTVPSERAKEGAGPAGLIEFVGKRGLDRALTVGAADAESLAPPMAADQKSWRSESAMFALFERALFVPGRVMNQWFGYYSMPDAREHGCGYRIVAWLKGCEFVSVPSKLYAEYYPGNFNVGIKGSLNSASFMIDYANFGLLGLLLSGLISAVLFVGIKLIYGNHVLALPLNSALILSLMETGLSTALNSGSGWIVATTMFLVFFRARAA